MTTASVDARSLTGPARSSMRIGTGLAYRALAVATVLSLVFGGLLLLAPTDAAAQTNAVTTSYLNLRNGPSTDAAIIRTMAPGESVVIQGSAENGFYPVTNNGVWGYAHSDWISTSGSAPADTTNTGVTGSAWVIDGALNLRSGPSTGYSVITVMPGNAQVSLTGESSGGFLGVIYNGTSGWASGQYLSTSGSSAPSSGNTSEAPTVGDTVVGSMSTNAYLNMRSGPSTGYGVITTMPSGASVEIMGDPQGGFYPIRYNGNKGWASGDYLTSGGSTTTPTAPSQPSGTVAVGDTVVGTMTTTSALNLRSGPSTGYGVISVMPGGASVSVMGDPQGGFYPLSYNGTKGWASADYLTSGGSTTTPTTPGTSSGSDITSIIYAAADRYGQPRADMLRVAQCESGLNPNAVNASSNASGLFQFLPGTWATTPYANQSIFDPVANANAAAWMWSVGRRNEWVCQ